MKRFGWKLGVLIVLSGTVAAAQERDPLVRARALHNQRQWEAAVTAADQARATAARADSANLIAARALLERFRESGAEDDLARARERLRRVNPQRFVPRERVELLIGLGETLFFEGSSGAAADMFDSVLAQGGAITGDERERVLDWWATSLDGDARTRTDLDRQAVYRRIRDRMRSELGLTPASTAAVYWLSAAARGQGDLQSAWEAAQAGWIRASLAGERGAALRADLESLVLTALVPERARQLGQPPYIVRRDWERFKERWTKP